MLKYEDSQNIKAGCVSIVVFNLHQIKRRAFFGTPGIALKHVIWRFRIRNYFREVFKFPNFMNTLRNFAKSVFARIFAKFKYLAKQFI